MVEKGEENGWERKTLSERWELPCGSTTLRLSQNVCDVFVASIGEGHDGYFGGVSWDLRADELEAAKVEALKKASAHCRKMQDEANQRLHSIRTAQRSSFLDPPPDPLPEVQFVPIQEFSMLQRQVEALEERVFAAEKKAKKMR
jgi:hypothetical protein